MSRLAHIFSFFKKTKFPIQSLSKIYTKRKNNQAVTVKTKKKVITSKR